MQTTTKQVEESMPVAGGERLWRVKDVAVYLSCSESYVYKAAERGELPHLTIGAMLRFDPEEIRAFARKGREQRASRERVLARRRGDC